MSATIKESIGTASTAQLLEHLRECDTAFIPHLSTRVDLEAYSQKLNAQSVTFEAWQEKELIGLIAAYFNDPETKTGYITSVSVTSQWLGKGIAARLLERCIAYAKEKGFAAINLEVATSNRPAIGLYAKYGFAKAGSNGEMDKMLLLIS